MAGSLQDARPTAPSMRTLVDALEVGVVVQAPSGEIVLSNSAAESILGLSADEIAGRTSTDPRWRAIRPNGDPFPGEEHPTMEALRTARSIRGVVMGVHKPSGELRWIVIDANLLRDGTGGVEGVVATFRDVTDVRRTAAELTESREQLAVILGHTPTVVFAYDADGRCSFARGNGFTPLGDPERIVGLHYRELAARFDAPDVEEGVGRAVAGHPWSGRVRAGAVQFDTTMQPVLDESGAVTSVLGVAYDAHRACRDGAPRDAVRRRRRRRRRP